MKSYPATGPGEAIVINPQKTIMHIACCDCGLVHRVEYFVSHRQRLKIRTWRLNRNTGQLRRHRKFRATTKGK